MSRRKAKNSISLQDYENDMVGVWSTSVNENTIDESSFAYKPALEIEEIISQKYEVVRHLKTLFNFKAN